LTDDTVKSVGCYTAGRGSHSASGYSDITALLNALHKKDRPDHLARPGRRLDVRSLHVRKLPPRSDDLRRRRPPPNAAEETQRTEHQRILKISPGKATGPLIGGDLTMIATLMGTPYQPETSGAIVFLEEVHEEPYRIDRMLTTLALGGLFDKPAGIIFGGCSDCGVKGPSLSLEEILRDRFGSLPIPAISGLSFGHIEQKLVLPIGARATLDADAGTVRVVEGAVVEGAVGLGGGGVGGGGVGGGGVGRSSVSTVLC
jgi:muramoyltetrapeptide carboxypeptidase LdcA involved in peptidoglycan recycling